jgi:nitrogen regulatory protein PII
MSKLVELLKYLESSKYDKKKMIDRPSFIKCMGKETHRELVLSEEVESDLLREEMVNVIVEGADYNKVIRDIVPVVKINQGDEAKIRIYEQSESFAQIVPELSKIELSQGKSDSKDVEYKKIATRIKISSELVEDSRWSEVELELRLAGARIENTLNRYALGVMLDGCTQSDISAINSAKILEGNKKLYDENFIADTLLLHQKGMQDIALPLDDLDKFKLDYDVLSMDTTDDFTAKWVSTSGTHNYYGLVFDSNAYARIVIREDINTNQIKDFKHDVTDLIAKMRVGVVVTQGKAGIRYKSS